MQSKAPPAQLSLYVIPPPKVEQHTVHYTNQNCLRTSLGRTETPSSSYCKDVVDTATLQLPHGEILIVPQQGFIVKGHSTAKNQRPLTYNHHCVCRPTRAFIRSRTSLKPSVDKSVSRRANPSGAKSAAMGA
jgi:hypothetical protein